MGIDLGIEKFAALSDGLAIANPGPVNVEKIKRLQRQLSRKKKGSKNRKKQRIRLQRKYKELRDKREDFLDKVSTAIAKRYDLIAVEDLNVKGMMRNHLAKAIADASWYTFKQKLKWKAEKYGKNLVEIGRFDPSSKLCSRCGIIKHDLTLSDRAYHCDACGLTMDRDLNAAINILNIGLIKVGLVRPELTPVEIAIKPARAIPVRADVGR